MVFHYQTGAKWLFYGYGRMRCWCSVRVCLGGVRLTVRFILVDSSLLHRQMIKDPNFAERPPYTVWPSGMLYGYLEFTTPLRWYVYNLHQIFSRAIACITSPPRIGT